MSDSSLRLHLDELVAALRPLHKTLLAEVQHQYETAHNRVIGPAALFHLVTRDPFFAWLRPLSGLMAQLDELLDEKDPLDPKSAAALRTELDTLLTDGSDFSARYVALLQTSHDLVVAHADLRRALAKV